MTLAYDIFLSYSSRDAPVVERLAAELVARGVTPFLDRWYLALGQPWPERLEQLIRDSGAVGVCVGPEGFGRWQRRELDLALLRHDRDSRFPIIPILLPGAALESGFLLLYTWVDLTTRIDDPRKLDTLAETLRGAFIGGAAPSSHVATLCPFRGLRAFREEDAPLFCGRDSAVDTLVRAVNHRSLVGVLGSSGSGKSSVVFAGLVPRLRRASSDSLTWEFLHMRPGERPLRAFAASVLPLLEPDLTEAGQLIELGTLDGALTASGLQLRDIVERVLLKDRGTDRLLVVIDQFEELYSECRDEATRRLFIDGLLDLARSGLATVALTLRADFYAQAIAYRPLADALQDATVNVGPMTREELEAAIRQPCTRVGLKYEQGLAELILNDFVTGFGHLPLLEFALTELWARRQGSLLTHAAYQAIGGISGAIVSRAEAVYSDLTPLQTSITREIFVQLVRPGDGTADTKRRAHRAELFPSSSAVAEDTLRRLCNARLLVMDFDATAADQSVELAHEALIDGWTRLRDWIAEDRVFRIWQENLRTGLGQWQRSAHSDAELLYGLRLAAAHGWLETHATRLSKDERHYLDASTALEKRASTVRRRRLVQLAAAFGVLLLAALTAAVYASLEWRRAERAHQVASARELTTRADLIRTQYPSETQRSLLLALESFRRVPSIEADHVLRQALFLLPNPISQSKASGRVNTIAFSPDGRYLAVAQRDGAVSLIETVAARKVLHLSHKGPVDALSFSADGQRIATASTADGEKSVRIFVWSSADGRLLRELTPIVDGLVELLAFSPTGRYLVGVSYNIPLRRRATIISEDPSHVFVWEASTGRQLLRFALNGGAESLAFSPDEHYLALGGSDKYVTLWELANARIVARMAHGARVVAVGFDPSGKTLATADLDDGVRKWSVPAGTLSDSRRLDIRRGHFNEFPAEEFSFTLTEKWTKFAPLTDGESNVAAFSTDARYLARASSDQVVRVWDIVRSKEVIRIGHDAHVRALALSSNGTYMAIVDFDDVVRIWSMMSDSVRTALIGHNERINFLGMDKNGRRLTTAGDDEVVRVWELQSGREAASFEDPTISGKAMYFGRDGFRIVRKRSPLSADGSYVVTSLHKGIVRVSEVSGRRRLFERSVDDEVSGATLSGDGRVVAAIAKNTVRVWEVDTGRSLGSVQVEGRLEEMVLNADGKVMATSAEMPSTGSAGSKNPRKGVVHIWRVLDGSAAARAEFESPIRGLMFSQDGQHLAAADEAGTAQVWEAPTGKLKLTLRGVPGASAIALGNDENYFAVGGRGGSICYRSGRRLRFSCVNQRSEIRALAFSPDMKYLASGSADGTVQIWDVSTNQRLVQIKHDSGVNVLMFGPDGRFLVSAGDDRTVRISLWRGTDLIREADSRLIRNLTASEWQDYLGPLPYRKTKPELP